MAASQTTNHDQKLDLRAYLILAMLLVGNVSTSSVTTIMGYYIVSVLQYGPWAISVYTVLLTTVSVGLIKWFGQQIDQGADIRGLLLISVLCFCSATVVLNMGANYGILLLVVAPLFALANASLSVMYTFGRLYAEKHNINIPKYNAFLRMNTSSGWIIGPGIAFGILGVGGIKASFMASFVLSLLWLGIWFIAIPKQFRNKVEPAKDSKLSAAVSLKLRVAAFACVCFACTNVLFTMSMPLFLIEELGFPEFAPGLSFAVKCFVEIPAIYGATLLATRWGDRQVLMLSALLAMVVMMLMSTVSSIYMLAIYAAFEGVYYGLFAGTMVGFMQSFADGRMGRATSIYVSSLFVGGMVGSISVGAVASFFGFKGAIYLAIVSACIAFLVMYFMKHLQNDVAA